MTDDAASAAMTRAALELAHDIAEGSHA
jgi:hypothetical protein